MQYFSVTASEARAMIAELQKVTDAVESSTQPDAYAYTKGFAADVSRNEVETFKFRIAKVRN